MRKFEKISYEQFKKDIAEEVDNAIIDWRLPKRATKHSAGYDFFSPIDITILPHSSTKIPTGIKACMGEDEVLFIYPRSSIGFKTNIRLSNTVGVVDSDYYNNANNEGHIFIKLYNPTEKEFNIKAGEKFAQGIFTKFLTVQDEEEIDDERNGGIGSTN